MSSNGAKHSPLASASSRPFGENLSGVKNDKMNANEHLQRQEWSNTILWVCLRHFWHFENQYFLCYRSNTFRESIFWPWYCWVISNVIALIWSTYMYQGAWKVWNPSRCGRERGYQSWQTSIDVVRSTLLQVTPGRQIAPEPILHNPNQRPLWPLISSPQIHESKQNRHCSP